MDDQLRKIFDLAARIVDNYDGDSMTPGDELAQLIVDWRKSKRSEEIK